MNWAAAAFPGLVDLSKRFLFDCLPQFSAIHLMPRMEKVFGFQPKTDAWWCPLHSHSLRLRHARHRPGDKPLGLIPALLHAGATLILGCQWPIDSRAGRAFSEVFYQELSRGGLGDESCHNVVHLAKALQSAVRRINSGELGAHYKQAYFWAPFALHGLWFFQS